MYRFTIRQQDYAKILAVSFLDLGPTSDAPILLDGFPDRLTHNPLDPLQLDE